MEAVRPLPGIGVQCVRDLVRTEFPRRHGLLQFGGKALDAVNKDTSKNGGRVQQWRPTSDDQTQVWILEKD